jgi:hypothetical protein
MSPEEALLRLLDLKVSDPDRYDVAMGLLRAAEARQVPRTPVTPARPEVRITEK